MQVSDSNSELKITICSLIKNTQARVPSKNKSCVFSTSIEKQLSQNNETRPHNERIWQDNHELALNQIY